MHSNTQQSCEGKNGMKMHLLAEVVACSAQKSDKGFFSLNVIFAKVERKLADGTIREEFEIADATSREPLKPGKYLLEVAISARNKGKDARSLSFYISRVISNSPEVGRKS
jgi:hypothetical protein